MATPFVLSPYFNTVPPENWNKADFVEAGNDMCFWCSSLAHIEESNENYSPVQRARAQTILNEDAYETFFARHPPHEWDMRRFIMFTKRPQAWAWAVDRGLGDSSLKSADAKAALLRCQEQKVSSKAKRSKNQKPQPKRPRKSTPSEGLRWTLRSNRVVEDVLAAIGGELAEKHILELNAETRTHFTDEEWAEILEVVKQPPSDREIPRFPDLDSLRTEGLERVGSEDRFEAWLGRVLLESHEIYRSGFLQHSTHGERTYDVIWSGFLDKSLLRSDFYISRGELQSRAVMELTNQGRARHESVKRGNKFDGIVYSIHESTLEYGFIEVSKGALTSYDVKSIDERTKLITAMRAAIVHCSHVVEKEEDFRNHVMLSVRTSGLTIQTMTMSPGKGQVIFLSSDNPLRLPKVYEAGAYQQVLSAVCRISDTWVRNKSAPSMRVGGWGWVPNEKWRLEYENRR